MGESKNREGRRNRRKEKAATDVCCGPEEDRKSPAYKVGKVESAKEGSGARAKEASTESASQSCLTILWSKKKGEREVCFPLSLFCDPDQ